MKKVHNFSGIALIGLTLANTLFGASAWADLTCQSKDGKVVVKAFELASGAEPFRWSKDAAIILNQGNGNILLTGKVVTTPTRVGSHVDYTVADPTGEESQLSYSIVDPRFTICKRTGCATLRHAGESHALECQSAAL